MTEPEIDMQNGHNRCRGLVVQVNTAGEQHVDVKILLIPPRLGTVMPINF